MPSYQEITSFVVVLFALAGAFVLFMNVYRGFKEIKAPATELREEVAEHRELLAKDNERLSRMEEESRMQSRCILQLMNHQIDGNHVEQLIRARDDMQEFLIEK